MKNPLLPCLFGALQVGIPIVAVGAPLCLPVLRPSVTTPAQRTSATRTH